MIYSLTCGKCGIVTTVESDIPTMEWKCVQCGNVSTTSLSTDGKGSLLTEVGVGSLVALTADADEVKGEEIVKSDPVGTETAAIEAAKIAEEEKPK